MYICKNALHSSVLPLCMCDVFFLHHFVFVFYTFFGELFTFVSNMHVIKSSKKKNKNGALPHSNRTIWIQIEIAQCMVLSREEQSQKSTSQVIRFNSAGVNSWTIFRNVFFTSICLLDIPPNLFSTTKQKIYRQIILWLWEKHFLHYMYSSNDKYKEWNHNFDMAYT